MFQNPAKPLLSTVYTLEMHLILSKKGICNYTALKAHYVLEQGLWH